MVNSLFWFYDMYKSLKERYCVWQNGTSQALLESDVKKLMLRESYAKDQQKEVFESVLRLIAEYFVV